MPPRPATAPHGGEFTADGHRFQLQRTDVIDMSNYNRYKGEDAVRWREKAKAKAQALGTMYQFWSKNQAFLVHAYGSYHVPILVKNQAFLVHAEAQKKGYKKKKQKEL